MSKIIIVLMLTVAGSASAATLYTTFEGTFSGSLDGVAFTDEPFVFGGVSDTANIVTGIGSASVVDDSVTLNLLGNLLTVTSNMSTRLNQTFGVVTLGNDDLMATPLNGPFDAVFQSWDLMSSIGPITGSGIIYQGGAPI